MKNDLKNWFGSMEPFKSALDIPELPRVSREEWVSIIVPNLIRCGAIPKSELKIGQWYEGDTRNSTKALWNGKVFLYERYKWGTYYIDKVNHFEDDDGYALFVPLYEIEAPETNCDFKIYKSYRKL